MGLFSSTDTTNDEKLGKSFASYVAGYFNDYCTPGTNVLIEPNLDGLRLASKTFDEVVALGFPDPGPFKRMAGFAVISQVYDLFEVIKDGPEYDDDTLPVELRWLPRITIFALPYFSFLCEVGSSKDLLEAKLLPTPHSQVEFINYLRNMRYGQTELQPPPPAELLLERITITALALEGYHIASHASADDIKNLSSLAEGCLAEISTDRLLCSDMIFNDPTILDAVGINVD